MNYKDKLKSVETFEQLFDLREELLSEEKKYSSVGKPETNFDDIAKCQDINFWLQRVVNRIKLLEAQGLCLDKIRIEEDKPESGASQY